MAIAARDRTRAEAFAAERGIAKVHDTYADVIADPDVDLVYNALVNSLHARWNIAALQGGQPLGVLFRANSAPDNTLNLGTVPGEGRMS